MFAYPAFIMSQQERWGNNAVDSNGALHWWEHVPINIVSYFAWHCALPISALNKDFFIFLAWKSIEKYFSTSQKFIQNNFSDQKSIEKYFFNSLKFISMIFSDQKIIR